MIYFILFFCIKRNEVQIQGQDGHIYKGRIDAKLSIEMKKSIKNTGHQHHHHLYSNNNHNHHQLSAKSAHVIHQNSFDNSSSAPPLFLPERTNTSINLKVIPNINKNKKQLVENEEEGEEEDEHPIQRPVTALSQKDSN
jgi:hypothetical protein